MDFIERWFGVSPDGGSGSLEFLCFFVLFAIGCAIFFRSRIYRLVTRKRNQSR